MTAARSPRERGAPGRASRWIMPMQAGTSLRDHMAGTITPAPRSRIKLSAPWRGDHRTSVMRSYWMRAVRREAHQVDPRRHGAATAAALPAEEMPSRVERALVERRDQPAAHVEDLEPRRSRPRHVHGQVDGRVERIGVRAIQACDRGRSWSGPAPSRRTCSSWFTATSRSTWTAVRPDDHAGCRPSSPNRGRSGHARDHRRPAAGVHVPHRSRCPVHGHDRAHRLPQGAADSSSARPAASAAAHGVVQQQRRLPSRRTEIDAPVAIEVGGHHRLGSSRELVDQQRRLVPVPLAVGQQQPVGLSVACEIEIEMTVVVEIGPGPRPCRCRGC